MNVQSFSGGRTSGYMLNRYGLDSDLIVFANTGKEHFKTLEFVNNCSVNFNVPIVWLEYDDTPEGYKVVNFDTASRDGSPFEKLIRKRKYLPNVVTRFCTTELKIRPIQKFIKNNFDTHISDVNMYIGIRYDEPRRYFKLKGKSSLGWWNKMPLYEDKVTKLNVDNFWGGESFDLEIPNYLGNCDLCFLKGINKRQRILKEYPEVGEWWSFMENEMGATFQKGLKIKDLLSKAQSQLDLFDPGIECICNVD